jgi:hypothetical protein
MELCVPAVEEGATAQLNAFAVPISIFLRFSLGSDKNRLIKIFPSPIDSSLPTLGPCVY